MKIQSRTVIPRILVFTIIFLSILVSCSKDAVENDSGTEAENEDEIITTPETDSNDTDETPTSGAIIFEETFVLNIEKSFVNMVLSPVDYNKFITGEGDLKAVSNKVYEYFEDTFDYIIILSIEQTQPEDLFYGRATQIKNDVQGLGSGLYDATQEYGSDGRLKSIIYMPRSEYVRSGPFLHEIAHTWANKGFLPSTVGGHWGFASTGGQLGGFDELVDLGNNTYRGRLNGQDGFGTFANGGNSVKYSNVELYLMGLIGPNELESVQVAENPVAGQTFGEFTADAIITYTAEDLINANGVRVPSFSNAQTEFKALAVIISKELLDDKKKNTIHADLENFARPSAPDANWSNNFWSATDGKASFEFEVFQDNLK